MTNIVQFSIQKEQFPTLPRQRVFYLGHRYTGPMFCQDIQNLYLKRKGISKGTRYWAVITYGKYDEDCSKEYSIELEECHEDDVIEMIDMFDLDSFPSIIKEKNKSMINWNIDREKLSKCKNLEYDIDDRYKKIYISLIFDSINKKNDILNCRINENNKKFDIKIL